MGRTRTLAVGLLTAGISVGLAGTVISSAAAQGVPVGGSGNAYYLQAPGSNADVAARTIVLGNADDNVYFGQLTATGPELPLVRRGNVYFAPSGASGRFGPGVRLRGTPTTRSTSATGTATASTPWSCATGTCC